MEQNGILNQYEDNYNNGYQEGFKAAKALVVTDLTISPNGFTMGAYTQRNLTVTAVLSDNSKKNVSGEIRWQSSDENVVKEPQVQPGAGKDQGHGWMTGDGSLGGWNNWRE